ncbi:hypothetical protein [Kaistia sp. MMO-174]|uniref:hypothetical protein n=1 Tax=Kaistia sp. MMO-174 TaxID=3081256 RepID=UPI00301B66CC
MAKLSRKKWPTLAEAWDNYGHQIAFDDLADAKVRSDGAYVVLAWKAGDGFCVADLAYSPFNRSWEMQNDSSDQLTPAQWRALYIVPECDWWRIKGEA